MKISSLKSLGTAFDGSREKFEFSVCYVHLSGKNSSDWCAAKYEQKQVHLHRQWCFLKLVNINILKSRRGREQDKGTQGWGRRKVKNKYGYVCMHRVKRVQMKAAIWCFSKLWLPETTEKLGTDPFSQPLPCCQTSSLQNSDNRPV